MKLSDYGLIGNSRAAALVSRAGAIEWCCLPKFDSPACFSSLLNGPGGDAAGQFRISPSPGAGRFQSRQEYLPDTNVLVTSFVLSGGARARILDSFSVTSQQERRSRLEPSEELLRVVEVEQGECEFEFLFRPVLEFGKEPLRLRKLGNWGFCTEHGQQLLALLFGRFPVRAARDDSCEVDADASRFSGRFRLRAGERMIFSLTHSNIAPAVFAPLGGDALERLDSTIRYWRNWVSHCSYRGRFKEEVRRSALALKLLSFSPSGAIVAAPTTSLPEFPGGVRNWDYRFCWLRDSSFTVEVLASLGFTTEAKAFTSWLLHSTRLTWPKLQVLYSVYGRTNIRERQLDWLAGFEDSRPVRIGNGAAHQRQLDIYGEVVEAFYRVLPHLERIDRTTAKLLRGIGRTVAREWHLPDSGIWEPRGEPRHHTHSKLMSWVALDRLARVGKREGWEEASGFESEARKIRDWIEHEGFSPQLGCYVASPHSHSLDSSLLTMPLLGFAHARSARIRRTREVTAARLGRGKLLYRYAPGTDGIPEPEGTFTICSFWMAESLILAGQVEEGLSWFEGVLRYRNSLGLWSEELLPETGEFLGNYPQAFTHIGLIHAARALDQAETQALRKGAAA